MPVEVPGASYSAARDRRHRQRLRSDEDHYDVVDAHRSGRIIAR